MTSRPDNAEDATKSLRGTMRWLLKIGEASDREALRIVGIRTIAAALVIRPESFAAKSPAALADAIGVDREQIYKAIESFRRKAQRERI